jgi:hypothetical protein
MLANCRSCAFWYQLVNEREFGECRKGCPDPVVTTKAAPHFVGPVNFRAIWPYTRAVDWCGEAELRGSVKDETEITIIDQSVSVSAASFDDAVKRAAQKRKM